MRVVRDVTGDAPSALAGAGVAVPDTTAWQGPRDDARSGARPYLAHGLFAALLVLGVLPVWLVAQVPTQDGGNHVESVVGLLRLPHSALLQRSYLPNYGLQPNWLTQALLAGLVQVVSPRVAEKLILSGYLVLLPLAYRALLPRTARGAWAALLIFPFVASYPFHMGFWNFSYSLVLFFVVLGYWHRTRGRMGARRGLGFTALTTLLFVAHSVSLASALAAMTAALVWRAALDLWRARHRPERGRRIRAGSLRRAIATYLYASPAIALLGLFLVHQPRPLSYRPPLLDYAKHLAGLYALVSFDRRELLVTCAVAAVIAVSVLAGLGDRTRRRLRVVDAWLAAGVLATALYFAMPDSAADGAQLNDRLALYPYFAALLWLGFAAVPARRVRAAALAVAALSVAGAALRLAEYRAIAPYVADYQSVAPHVAEGSTLLPLTFAPFGPRRGGAIDGKKLLSYRVQPFTHQGGYVATDRRGIDLDNSQANTHHTPLRWRDELNPFTYLSTRPFGMEAEPPCVELWAYEALGGRVDYVVLWGATAAAARDECGGAVLRELRAGYDRVYVSPMGMAELYRRADRPLPAPPASTSRAE